MLSGIFATQYWFELTFAGHLNCEWAKDFTNANVLESPPGKTKYKYWHFHFEVVLPRVLCKQLIICRGHDNLFSLPGSGRFCIETTCLPSSHQTSEVHLWASFKSSCRWFPKQMRYFVIWSLASSWLEAEKTKLKLSYFWYIVRKQGFWEKTIMLEKV